ncbi:flocculation protein [Tasmannia lanceolata]|uniref:flocculation protein n=1 Tax=Tasmannia lanceolata TaxID=3420 RepID=UPI0040638D75
MVSPKKEGFTDDGNIESSDRGDLEQHGDESLSRVVSREIVESSEPSDVVQESRRNAGLAERLRGIFGEDGDGDLLLQRSDRENGFLQWLEALDLQAIGACRADERLKPLLKLNVSGGVAEDRLLAHLSQHFEAPEVGMLARCLCLPLVSVRVGKVIKQGSILSPTATRGHLNLTLLPSSDLRISFAGDDGCTERLALLSTNSETSAVTIEEIVADTSGRSFLIKLPVGRVSYFWCSEKSKVVGAELLTKMKDLLGSKPSLAQLTGISESRLDCFATHLQAYLLGSTSASQSNPNTVSSTSPTTASDSLELDQSTQSLSASSKTLRSRSTPSQSAKSHSSLYPGSLSPRSNTFKDGSPRSSLSIRSGAREKFRRRVDSLCSLAIIDTQPIASTSTLSMTQTSDQTENDKLSEGSQYNQFPSLSMPETFGSCSHPSSCSSRSFCLPLSQVTTSSASLFSPYYCWCPPCTSVLQYTVTPPYLPSTSAEPLSLPPLSSLLSVARSSSSLIPPNLPLDLTDIPSLDFPAFLPDPLMRFPLPVSSFITGPSSQQIPTFTPFMSDPIVHIPVIGVCSSGPGYLVSAGPAISTTISPLLPNHLMNQAESVVEKSARETLRLLIGSTQTSPPPLMEMLPAVLTRTDSNYSCVHGMKHSPLVVGSRGFYSGTRDVDAVASSVTTGVVSLLGRSKVGDGGSNRARRHAMYDLVDREDKSLGEDGSEAD